jgi:hypothetical protein
VHAVALRWTGMLAVRTGRAVPVHGRFAPSLPRRRYHVASVADQELGLVIPVDCHEVPQSSKVRPRITLSQGSSLQKKGAMLVQYVRHDCFDDFHELEHLWRCSAGFTR